MASRVEWDRFWADARAADILAVAQSLGARLKSAATAELAGPCPACGGEDRFSINVKKRVFNCRGSEGGDVIKLVEHVTGCSPIEAAERLTGKSRPDRTRDETLQERNDRLKRNADRLAQAHSHKEQERKEQERKEQERKEAEAKAKRDEEAIDKVLERALDLDDQRAKHGKAYLVEKRRLNPKPSITRDIRYVEGLDYWGYADYGSGQPVLLATLPAIIAIIRDALGAVIGYSATYLDPIEPRKWRPIGKNSPTKVRGRKQGGLIRLGRIGEHLAVAEGCMNALAWHQEGHGPEGISLAAAVDLSNLAGKATGTVPHPTLRDANGRPRRMPNGEPDPDQPGFILPDGVTEVWLLGDYDSEVFTTAAMMAVAVRRLMGKGIQVHVHFPPTPGFDWNDHLLRGGENIPAEPEPLPANATYDQRVAAFRHPPRMETGAEFLGRVSFLFDPPKVAPEDGPPPQGDPIDADDTDREERDLWRRIIEAPSLAYEPEPQRKWIVEDVIPDETLTLLSGEGGIGKTTLALQLAVAMRTGGEWLGVRVAQEPVLFVTSEDDRRDVNLNLRAILKAEAKGLAHCPGLHVLSLADRDACLAAAPSKLAAVTATPLWHALVRVIQERKPGLVVFDALADLFGGDEISRRHARGFIVLLKQLAIKHYLAVLLIAHPSLAGISTGTGLSGSTDWHNGPRARLYFQKPKDNDDKTMDDDARTLTVMKVQYAREGTVFRVRRREGVFVYEGREGGGSSFDRAATAAKAESVFLALLRSYEEQGRRVSPNRGANYGPIVFEREEDAQGVTKRAFARAMGRLLKANRIHVERVGPRSRQREKLTLGPAPEVVQ
jgi:RecA-family ATPase